MEIALHVIDAVAYPNTSMLDGVKYIDLVGKDHWGLSCSFSGIAECLLTLAAEGRAFSVNFAGRVNVLHILQGSRPGISHTFTQHR